MSRQQTILIIDEDAVSQESFIFAVRAAVQDAIVMIVTSPDRILDVTPSLILWNMRAARMEDGTLPAKLDALRRRIGNAPVLAVAKGYDIGQVSNAIKYGLCGLVPVNASAAVLGAAIRLVLAGELFIPADLA